jgi:hypothetical protein
VVVPFLVHQVLDYLAGLYLIQAGSKASGRGATVCYIAGAVVLLAATLSGRPLGGGPISRPAHRVVDIVIILGLAATPFVFGLTDQGPTTVRLEGVAIILGALMWFTKYARPAPRNYRETGRAIKQHGPRVAGQMIGRRMAGKRRPPDAS